MDSPLSTLDLILVIAYVAGTTLLGAWFARGQRDVRTYFVGDRNVGWPLVLASIVATETSTVTFLSVPGVAFGEGGNLTFLQLSLGYILGRGVVAWLLLPAYLRGEWFTAYQLLRERFNPVVQRTASGLFLVTRTVADGLRLYLTALLLGQFTGWNMTLSLVVMSLITLAYTYLGGMEAVIWTDLLQLIIYLLGAILAGLIILQMLPGGWSELREIGESAGKFRLFDTDMVLTKPYTLWAGVFGGAFFSMASHGADQIMVQRYLCSRSLSQARVALILSGFVVLAQFLLFQLIGIGLFALKTTGQLTLEPGIRNDEVFGAFIVRHLPSGLIGLVIAAVLAAAMSTLSSSLNSSASALVNDFYRPLHPGQDESHYLRISRLSTLIWGGAQLLIGLGTLSLGSPRSVVDQVLSVAGFTTGIILGLFLLGQAKRPVSSTAAVGGMLVGFGTVTAAWYGTALAWPWYAPLGALVTVTVALLANTMGLGHGSSTDRGAQPGLDGPR